MNYSYLLLVVWVVDKTLVWDCLWRNLVTLASPIWSIVPMDINFYMEKVLSTTKLRYWLRKITASCLVLVTYFGIRPSSPSSSPVYCSLLIDIGLLMIRHFAQSSASGINFLAIIFFPSGMRAFYTMFDVSWYSVKNSFALSVIVSSAYMTISLILQATYSLSLILVVSGITFLWIISVRETARRLVP